MTDRSSAGYIGPGLVVQGALSGKGDLQIDGSLTGELELDGHLVIGADGKMNGTVTTSSIVVDGWVRGDVSASGSVSVRAGGGIRGDVRASRLAVDDGGALHGLIDMHVDLPADLLESTGPKGEER